MHVTYGESYGKQKLETRRYILMHFLKVISTQDKKNYRSIIGLKQSNSALFHLVVKSDQSIDVNEKPALEKMFYIERDLGIEIKHWCTVASTACLSSVSATVHVPPMKAVIVQLQLLCV